MGMYMRVSINGDTQKWVVYFMENPKRKWLRTGGTPILGNLHIYIYICIPMISDGILINCWLET
jgi:hypothetical protein